jgi:acyl phosphate:glycerol-3-phosphate acyltransferase
MPFEEIFAAITSYLIGSFPTAYIFGKKILKKDIRNVGTMNMGALNAFQTLGKFYGFLTFLIDALKGIIPVFVAIQLQFSQFWIGVCGLMAIIGHNWSIYIKFKSGKGASTTIGLMISMFSRILPASIIVFGIFFLLTHNVSLGLALCFGSLPIFALIFYSHSQSLILVAILIPIIILIRLSPDIKKLFKLSKGNIKEMTKILILGFYKYENNLGIKEER